MYAKVLEEMEWIWTMGKRLENCAGGEKDGVENGKAKLAREKQGQNKCRRVVPLHGWTQHTWEDSEMQRK